MKRALLGFALPLLGLTPGLASTQADGLTLRGVVFSAEHGQTDRKYLGHVMMTLIELRVRAETDDQGYFRVRLPAGVLAGQDVTLQDDSPDYYILFPVLSRLRVPAPAPRGNPEPIVEVWMAPKGTKVLLGANFIEQFIVYTADDSAKKPKDPKGGAPDLSSYVNELARQSGRPVEEILAQISRWVADAKESDDPRTLGLAAFAEKKFRLAAESFGRAADAEKRRGAEGYRKSAADRTLEGDSHSNALDFAKALKAYQEARDDLGVYRKGRDDLGLPAYPESAADVQNLSLKIADVKGELGIRVAGPDSRRYLNEAVHECRGHLAQISKISNPRQWAGTLIYLGNALQGLGERQGGAEGPRRLADAVEAYREALGVYTRIGPREDWAMTQNNLGNALTSLGERQSGEEGVLRLAEAVKVYREALTVCTRNDLPQFWAMTQNNLGNALQGLGERHGGAEGPRRLADAVEAYQEALSVYTRIGPREDWAMDPEQPGQCAYEAGRAAAWRGRSATAGRGGQVLSRGPHRLHPRQSPPALGHDPEQPGCHAWETGRATERRGGGAAAGRGGRGLSTGPHRTHPQ
jgi:tetratricopeptide (TPR) repeat protein